MYLGHNSPFPSTKPDGLNPELEWNGLVYVFNGISTPYELFNAEFGFIFKCLIVIIAIFSMF